jgi:hypothetical protein
MIQPQIRGNWSALFIADVAATGLSHQSLPRQIKQAGIIFILPV